MLDRTPFEIHGLLPLDGHKPVKAITFHEDSICLTYLDNFVQYISNDDLIFLYNDALYDISYYKNKCEELRADLDIYAKSYDELSDQLYG